MADVVLSDEAIEFEKQFEEAIKKIEPKNSGLVTEPDQEDFNYWNKAKALTLSAAQGVVNAVEEQGDFLDENIISLGGLEFGDNDGKFTFKDLVPSYVTPKKWKEGAYSQERNLPIFHKPTGTAEQMTEGATRFITGFVGPSKILKGVGLGGGIVKTGLRGMTAGAVADLTVFDPAEGRLSDMLVEFDSPVLNNAVTQYLATDEDDTEMEGRIKNVLEGMAIGGPLEILFGIKAFKKAKKTKDIAKKEKIYKDAGEAIESIKKGKKTKKVKEAIFDGNEAINAKEAVKALRVGQKEAKKETESFIKKILNTRSFKNASQVLKTIDDVSESFDDATVEYLQNDVLRNETAEELAKLLSRDKSEVLKAMTKDKEFAKQGTVRMLASKQIIQELALTLKEVSEKYLDEFGDDVKNWTKEAQLEVGQLGGVLRDSVVALKDQIRGAARMTQAGRIKVARSEGKVLDVDEMSNIVKKFDGNAAAIAKNIKNKKPEEVIDAVAKTKYQRTVEVFNSLYINSLLSGVFTQALNIKSGMYEAFIRPLEIVSGGLARADLRSIRLGFAQYRGMMLGFGDTMKAVSLALRQGDAILDPLQRTQDNLQIVGSKAVRPISGANLGFEGAAGTIADYIGIILELPSRLLMTGDELLKQLSYRGRLYTNALDNTMERGLSLYSKEGRNNIKRIFDEGFDKNGHANIKDNPINEEALQYARVSTYTNTLKGGTYLDLGSKIQTFLNTAPEFRFLAPFIRTPTNLWRHFGNRIPGLGIFTKQNRDLWNSGDRRARAEVLGRQFLGMAAVMYGFSLATERVEDENGNSYPKITGNGPSDFRIKKQWLQLGWQPYSIAQKNEDGTVTYKQYNRMDPRFFPLGIVADIIENIGNLNDQQKEDAFSSAVLTVMKNLTNKTYLRGISDALELISDPNENNISRFFGNVAGNYIPYSSLRRQGIPGVLAPDEQAYETRSFVDEVLENTPFTESLDPRVDILTGDPITKNPSSLYLNPDGIASYSFWFMGPSLVGRKSDVKTDAVTFEIARLRIPLENPQKIKFKIVDLTEETNTPNGKSAYQYLLENTGKVKIDGKNLKEQLANLFESNTYKLASEGDITFEGGKEFMIDRIFSAYKKAAYIEMLKLYPETAKKINKAREQKFKTRAAKGDDSLTKDLFPVSGENNIE
nr:protein transporter sec31 [uncultured Mediterranean phage uvMED]